MQSNIRSFSSIFAADFIFNEEDPFLDPVGLESGLTMTKKKIKKCLTLDQKIKEVLNEETIKNTKLDINQSEQMDIDQSENDKNDESEDDNVNELDIETKDNVKLKQTTLKVLYQTKYYTRLTNIF